MPDESPSVPAGVCEDQEGTTVSHLSGPAITFGPQVRQRCVWCGFIIEDTDLTRVAVMLNEDGSTPPWSSFPEHKFLRITGNGGFRGTSVVSEDELFGDEDDSVRVPDDCCMRLPAELTGKEAP